MKGSLKQVLFSFLFVLLFSTHMEASTINFSNLTWQVREGTGGPGPNNWSANNVWVDANGWLHLKITCVNNKWYCPEISTLNSFGFGRYTFYLNSRVDNLDPNVVLGLFQYPLSDPDGTHEIDIEFARWGQTSTNATNGSYTVYPTTLSLPPKSLSFKFATTGGSYSTFGYTRKSNSIYYQSSYGHYPNYDYPIQNWMFAPSNYLSSISQKSMPIFLNLWLFNGKPPINNQPVEIVIEKVWFTSLDGTYTTF